MKTPKNKRTGGWQTNIEYFEDYVIKTPKTIEEITATVFKYLNHIGKIDELEKRVSAVQKDWEVGLKIVKSGRIPYKMLGHLEFLDGGKIKQTKVDVLQDIWDELYNCGKESEMKVIVDKSLDFIVELWRYGVGDKTFKIGYEYGRMGDEIILIDFGELTEDKKVIEKKIRKKAWEGKMKEYSHPEVAEYFNEKASEIFTLEVLNENWGKYGKSTL